MTDKQSIKQAALEVEGMLRILESRPEDSEAYSLLLEKMDRLRAELDACAEAAPAPAPEEAPLQIVEEQAEVEVAAEEPAEEAEQPEMVLDFSTDAPQASPFPPFASEFSINDKYMYIRELFGGSTSEFAKVMDTVDAMADLGDAYDYFLNELGWDADDEHVGSFLSIVAKHFNTIQ